MRASDARKSVSILRSIADSYGGDDSITKDK